MNGRKSAEVRLTPAFRPDQQAKRAPCQDGCPNCGDIRAWINVVAQRRKTGLSREQAYERAWRIITDVNPLPAVLGRICPHPCEAQCNRADYDGALGINAMERFLGDWAIDHGLSFDPSPRCAGKLSVGVVGSGPSGLSFAYQMSRRGYRVTIYEAHSQPGGMLRHGVPRYRLPCEVLTAEIRRILDMGVELVLDIRVGSDISLQELQERHTAIYLGLGAQAALALGIEGESGPGVWRGTEYLGYVNRGQAVSLGQHAVIIGGGNTAVDAARMARRSGAEVTIVYRRDRADMPAASEEIKDALAEGVDLLTHCSPLRILRSAEGMVEGLELAEMRPGEPDDSGRRQPVTLADSEFILDADAVIAAISQAPVLDGFDSLRHAGSWLVTDDAGYVGETTLAGGDALGLGIAGNAIVQGRHAAEQLLARLSGDAARALESIDEVIRSARIDFDHKPTSAPVRPLELPVHQRVAQATAEVRHTLREAAFLAEVDRCYSCGDCMGCGLCEMFCTVGSFTRLAEVKAGMYFSLALDACAECGKCVAVCPSAFLEVTPARQV